MPNPNAPVYLVLSEVRFSSVMGLEGYIPAIQEQLRKSGFPDFQERVTQRLVIAGGIVSGAENTPPASPQFTSQITYVFADIEGQEVITLNTSSVSFQTTNYESFETFSQTFLRILAIIHHAMNISFFDRIGVRYLDAIQANSAGNFDDDVVAEAIGVYRLLANQLEHSYSQNFFRDGAEQLLVRVYIQNSVLAVPDDLFGRTAKISERFTVINGLHLVLDNDAAYEKREVFLLEKIETILKNIKSRAAQSFKKIVKSEALQKWGL